MACIKLVPPGGVRRWAIVFPPVRSGHPCAGPRPADQRFFPGAISPYGLASACRRIPHLLDSGCQCPNAPGEDPMEFTRRRLLSTLP
ncbi:hypothetical protein, partial [Streptomyces phytophilus]|uniref:hypothetical protein n=1 Tax=Streptomyces phytophilus TaxID=722715 RepID=UPI001C69271C